MRVLKKDSKISEIKTKSYVKLSSAIHISDALSDQEHSSCFSFINEAGVCDDNPDRADWQYTWNP